MTKNGYTFSFECQLAWSIMVHSTYITDLHHQPASSSMNSMVILVVIANITKLQQLPEGPQVTTFRTHGSREAKSV